MDGRNDRPSTVTLAAHARRGLKMNPRRCIMRLNEKYACGTDTQLQLLENSGLATSVGSVFGKPGPHTRPSCYVYCLHRARNGQNLVHPY